MRSARGSLPNRSRTASSALRLLVIVVVAGLVAAACGGDDEPSLENSTGGDTIEATSDATTASAGETDGAGTSTAGPDDSATATAESDEDTGEPAVVVPFPTPAPVSGDAAFTASSKLTTIGLGEIFFGDTPRDAAQKERTDWIGLPEQGTRPQCFTMQPTGGPSGTVFMVLDGRIERVDIASPEITTRSGIGVGSTEAEINELFADNIEVTETPGGNEIAFVPTDESDRDFRIIWTTDGTTVTAMRAGRLPGVLSQTPCS